MLRPHFGEALGKEPALKNLHRFGYQGDLRLALLPPIILDPISTDLLLYCEPPPGNDLLTIYRTKTSDG